MPLSSFKHQTKWGQKIQFLITSPFYLFEIGISSLLLVLAIWWQSAISLLNDISGIHSAVGDTLFLIVPRLDLSYLYLGGIWGIIVFCAIYCLWKIPEKIPQALLALALFFFIRGICIAATDIGVPTDHIVPHIEGIPVIHFFRNDLFFSGHTGIPFLVALFIWKDVLWRNVFLGISVLMAFTVISMRLHYSIDIIGAYFITYGINHIAGYLYTLFTQSSSLFVRYQAEKNKKTPPNTKNNSAPV